MPVDTVGCNYRIYDSTGTVVDSGSYLIALGKPTAEIDPRAAQGTFITSGCTPWVRIKPLPPDW